MDPDSHAADQFFDPNLRFCCCCFAAAADPSTVAAAAAAAGPRPIAAADTPAAVATDRSSAVVEFQIWNMKIMTNRSVDQSTIRIIPLPLLSSPN